MTLFCNSKLFHKLISVISVHIFLAPLILYLAFSIIEKTYMPMVLLLIDIQNIKS